MDESVSQSVIQLVSQTVRQSDSRTVRQSDSQTVRQSVMVTYKVMSFTKKIIMFELNKAFD